MLYNDVCWPIANDSPSIQAGTWWALICLSLRDCGVHAHLFNLMKNSNLHASTQWKNTHTHIYKHVYLYEDDSKTSMYRKPKVNKYVDACSDISSCMYESTKSPWIHDRDNTCHLLSVAKRAVINKTDDLLISRVVIHCIICVLKHITYHGMVSV